MKLRLLLAVVAGAVLGTPAGRARLARLAGRAPGVSPTRGTPPPLTTAATAPLPVANPLDAPPITDTGVLGAHPPLGPDSTGAEVAIDLFEHGDGQSPAAR